MRAGHRILLGSIVIVFMGTACDLWHEPGPMPSTIIETEFEPGLNIFGVLRQDGEPGSSYIYIERAYQYNELDTLDLEELRASFEAIGLALIQHYKLLGRYREKN